MLVGKCASISPLNFIEALSLALDLASDGLSAHHTRTAVIAHQIYKNYRPEVFGAYTPLLFAHAHKALRARLGPYWDKHDAALVKLVNKGARHFRPASSNNDTVKWRGFGHAERAVAPLHVDTPKSQLPQEA